MAQQDLQASQTTSLKQQIIDIDENFDDLYALIAAIAAGSGVTVSADDDTVRTLSEKLLAGTNITLTVGNDGGDETLTVASAFLRLNKTQANSPYTVTAANVAGHTTFTNTGASGQIIFNLPAGADGEHFSAVVTAAQYLQLKANGTEVLSYLGTDTAAGGYIRANVIGYAVAGEWNGTKWVITNMAGTWQYDE